MPEEVRKNIIDELSTIENYINLYLIDSMEKTNALTKIAEAIFWITYEGEENE